MFPRNSLYPLPSDEALSTHMNGEHDHVSRYKSYYQKNKLGLIGEKILLRRHAQPIHPRFSNCAKQDLPLSDSRIGVFEPPLSSTIIHGLLLY